MELWISRVSADNCSREDPGGSAPEHLRAKWDARYRDSDRVPSPAKVLADNLHLLPMSGRALDLACGLGANALLLAERGLDVSAWDLSPAALRQLREESHRRGLNIDIHVRDIQARPPASGSFDIIVVSHFLDRAIIPAIADALSPGGLLFYQTFTCEAVSNRGPSNPGYRLAPNELLRLFPGLILRAYREDGRVGDLTRGSRDVAFLVAQMPF